MNIYTVQFGRPVQVPGRSNQTSHAYVTASSFEAALKAARDAHPDSDIRSVSMQNYSGIAIIAGE